MLVRLAGCALGLAVSGCGAGDIEYTYRPDPGVDVNPACLAGTCVERTFEWDGPLWARFSPDPTAFGAEDPILCPDSTAGPGPDFHADFTNPPAYCPSCTCLPSKGQCELPSTFTASPTNCKGGGQPIPFDAPPSWDGACDNSAPVVPPNTAKSLTVGPLTIKNESCAVGTPGPAEGVTQYWGTFVRTCYGKGWTQCNNPQGSCIPWGTQPSPDFRLCIIRPGVHDDCQPSWPEKFTIYTGVKDDRHCVKDCACGPPAGSMCVAHASVYQNSDTTCGGPTVANLDNIGLSSLMPTCNDINPPGQPLGSKSATAPTYLPGACDVIPGVADGEAIPLEPSTLCCRTEPLL